jgi:hypothetical protein
MAGGVPRSCCLRRGGQQPGGRARHRRLPAGHAHRCVRVDEVTGTSSVSRVDSSSGAPYLGRNLSIKAVRIPTQKSLS